MFEQAVAEQKAKLQTQATQEFAQLKQDALESPDFRDAPDKFKQEARQRVQDLVSQANPVIQDELRRDFARSITADTIDLRREAAQKSQRAAIASFEQETRAMADQYATGNEVKRRQAIESLQDSQQRLVRSGALTPEEAQNRFQQARREFDRQRVAALRDSGNLNAAQQYVEDAEYLSQDDKRTLNEQIENDLVQANEDLSQGVESYVQALAQGGGTVRGGVTFNGFTPDQLKAATSGTELGERIQSAEEAAGEVRRFSTMSVEEQRRLLENPQGTDFRTLQMMQQAHEGQIEAFRDGRALDLLERQGKVQDLTPLDLSNQGSDSFQRALRERKRAAQRVADHYGMDTPTAGMYFKAAEVQQIKQVVEQGNAQAVQQTFANIRQGLGKRAVRQLSARFVDDNPQRAWAMFMSSERPEVSRTVLEAEGSTDQLNVAMTSKDIREPTQEVLGSSFEADARTQQAVVDAAKDVYAQWSLRAGDIDEFNETRFKRALRLTAAGQFTPTGQVSGGPVEINGKKTLPPMPGMDGEKFTRLFSQIDDDAISRHSNGTPVFREPATGDFEEVTPEDIRDKGQLVRAGADGKYIVRFDGDRGGLHTKERPGQPFILDLEAMAGEVSLEPDQPEGSTAADATPGPQGLGTGENAGGDTSGNQGQATPSGPGQRGMQ
jgi:hypothetical protein